MVYGYDYWQIEMHGGPSLPSWYKRPYLSGRYLLIPQANKTVSPEVEASKVVHGFVRLFAMIYYAI